MLLLEVFPGWPEPTPLSNLHLVLICVLLPLAFGAVVTAMGLAPSLMKRNRDEAAAAGLGEPVGERETAEVEPVAGRRALTD